MSAALARTTATRSALRSSTSRFSRPGAAAAAALGSTSFARGKATLPDLPYDYAALEPSISGKIMELHHKNHHNTYVTSYNNFSEQLQEAEAKNNIPAQISLLPLINFHGGGHTNHSLFWENLAPKGKGGGEPPSGALAKKIDETFGGLEKLQSQMNTALAGIQGSGWAWLVREKATGNIGVRAYANQDAVVGAFEPLLGIDAWEHAYYLQYQNRKAEYFKAIWDVINWKEVEKRFG